MIDSETIEVYDNQVDHYAELVGEGSADPYLLNYISMVKPAGYVLDFGCGPGQDAAIMQENGLRVDAVDASAGMVQLAIERFGLNARQARFEDLDSVDSYDGVWASFSLLHAPVADFPHILEALHRALVMGGVLHLGMKTGTGTRRDKLGRFYAYYPEQALCTYLVAAGFRVEHVESGEAMGLAGDVEPWIKFIARA